MAKAIFSWKDLGSCCEEGCKTYCPTSEDRMTVYFDYQTRPLIPYPTDHHFLLKVQLFDENGKWIGTENIPYDRENDALCWTTAAVAA